MQNTSIGSTELISNPRVTNMVYKYKILTEKTKESQLVTLRSYGYDL